MAARRDADTRPRMGGTPQPQTVQEIEESVDRALDKLTTVVALFQAWVENPPELEYYETALICPLGVLRQAQGDLIDIEWPRASDAKAARVAGGGA